MMTGNQFLSALYRQLATELTGNHAIRRLTNNPALIGAYAEATVRRIVSRVVAPLRVSRGAVIYEGNCATEKRADPAEVDTIIWLPCPAPAIFEAGDFALVPRGSAVGMLEIKSTNYSDAAKSIEDLLRKEPKLMHWPGEPPEPSNALRRALGVVCMRTKSRDGRLDALIEKRDAVVLLEQTISGKVKTNGSSMRTLVNFLVGIRRLARCRDGLWYLSQPQITPASLPTARPESRAR